MRRWKVVNGTSRNRAAGKRAEARGAQTGVR
jgi:hypothetical protein